MTEEVSVFLAATLNLKHFDLQLAKVVAADCDAPTFILLMEGLGFVESQDSTGSTAVNEFDRDAYLPASI